MGSKLRGAVVGVGYLGNFHAQKIKNNSQSELVGVFDQYTPQAQKISSELSVPAFTDLNAMLGKVDFVTIAAATQAHYDVAQFFLKNKIPVLVEKPIAATSKQGFELSELADKNDVVFSVGHIERFNPAYNIIKETYDQTQYFEINRLAPFRARGADVSVLHDLMIHDLDLVQYLFKSEISDYLAYGHKFIKETIDDVSVRLVLESGLQVTINNSRLNPTIVRNYRAVQAERTVFVNTATLEGEVLKGTSSDPFYVTEKFNIAKVDALALEIDHFIKAVKGEVSVAITGFEASKALQSIETILGSIEAKS